MSIPLIDLNLLKTVFSRLERGGVAYGYGVKAPSLTCDTLDVIQRGKIDCSGFSRYALAKATEQQLILPDGSQAQREWCENSGLRPIAHYADINAYGTTRRLFICFIKPFTNGCGDVGHVWFVNRLLNHDHSTTMESCGAGGVVSRPWNARTLFREFYSAFELPTK